MGNSPAPLVKQTAFQTIRTLIQKAEPQIAARLPQHLTAEKVIAVALTTIQQNTFLLHCTPLSILGTIIQASELGLQLNGFLGEAYMVPFRNRHLNGGSGGYEAQFQAGYRGLISLARRSGQVSKIESRLVYEFDTHFKLLYGTSAVIEHEPNVDHPQYGLRYPPDHEFAGDLIGLRGAYAIVTFTDGTTDFEYCNLNRLDELRNRSKARDRDNNETGPWTTDPGEMYRKVPIRQIAKRLPLSPEFQKAAVLDEYGDAGVQQNNAAIIEADQSFAGVMGNITQAQVAGLRDKYVAQQQQPAAAPPQAAAPKPPQAAAVPNQPRNRQRPAARQTVQAYRPSNADRGYQEAFPA